jgi:hypothetical protein
LIGGDREIGDCTADVAKQRPANNNGGMVFFVLGFNYKKKTILKGLGVKTNSLAVNR